MLTYDSYVLKTFHKLLEIPQLEYISSFVAFDALSFVYTLLKLFYESMILSMAENLATH